MQMLWTFLWTPYYPHQHANTLTAEGLIAPVDDDALLSAVSGVGSEDGAVTRPLGNTSADLWQTETKIGLPLHHIMTRLQNHRGRCTWGRQRWTPSLNSRRFNTLYSKYLKDGAVYDGAHCLCVPSPLGVCGAGVRWSTSRQSTMLCCEFPCKGGHTVLHVSFWGGKVIMLVPGQCSTQAAHLQYSIYTFLDNSMHW